MTKDQLPQTTIGEGGETHQQAGTGARLTSQQSVPVGRPAGRGVLSVGGPGDVGTFLEACQSVRWWARETW
jgi:hypothetical protein